MFASRTERAANPPSPSRDVLRRGNRRNLCSVHVARHLEDCWDCGDRVEAHVKIRQALARKCSESTSEDLAVRIRSLIEREIERGPGSSEA